MTTSLDGLDGLDGQQRAAASAVTGPVCIIAGAGTGKTRTVTHRLAYGISTGRVAPGTALAVTHSRKAAAELAQRLRLLGVGGVDARTFHAAALAVAREHWAMTGRPGSGPLVMAEADQWRALRSSLQAALGRVPDNAEVRDVADEVGWARSRLVRRDRYEVEARSSRRESDIGADVVVRAWEAYERAKTRAGVVDFADLLDIASDVVQGNETAAEAVRRRWAHITVDEYQDTDPSQQRLLQAVIGGGRDICVVGDPRQAIYSWKGADPSYLTGFAGRYPGAQVFDLTQNYRSPRQVLEWANRLARGGQVKPLVATKPDGRRPKVTKLDNEQAEAAWVAGAAKRAIAAGTPPQEIAVLYRFGATQARFEAAFARAGVAVTIAQDVTFFQREEVLGVLKPFGQAARAKPSANGLELLAATLSSVGFDRDKPPSGFGAARGRWESHQALAEMAEAMPDQVSATAQVLLAELQGLARHAHDPRQEGVTLATLHKSKGLEWDVVFVVGVVDKVIPSSYAESTDELAEEERLLHVGITRARRELHLTWPAMSNRGWPNRPSPFLDLLPGAVAPVTKRAEPGSRAKSGGARAPVRVSAECPHCAAPLKGIAARRLGVCADCVLAVPGHTGETARALKVVVDGAAREAGVGAGQLVSPSALLRLLDLRPGDADGVAATAGVGLSGGWALAAADVLAG